MRTNSNLFIDVILPTHNGSLWVHEAIKSVIDQTFKNWRLTIVDDVSTDDTVQKVKSFCATYPDRIRLIQLERNRRAAGARMEAIRKTDHDIIAFIDQDDRWYSQKLEKQIERFNQAPKVEAVHTDIEYIDESGNVMTGLADAENAIRNLNNYEDADKRELLKIMFFNKKIRLCSSAFRRKSFENVGGFNESLFGGEDWEFWIRFAYHCNISHIAIPLVERRLHDDNTSQKYRKKRTEGLFKALSIVENQYPDLFKFVKRRRIFLLKRAILDGIERNRDEETLQYLRKLIGLRPLNFISRIFYLFIRFMRPHIGISQKLLSNQLILKIWLRK